MGRPRKDENVFAGYTRVGNPDYESLSILVKEAQGSRTLTEFAKECGVSAATLSRIINKKSKVPCADYIIKKVYENADNDAHISLNDLLAAHGLRLADGADDSVHMMIGDSQVIRDTQSLRPEDMYVSDEISRAQFASVLENTAYLIFSNIFYKKGYNTELLRYPDTRNDELQFYTDRFLTGEGVTSYAPDFYIRHDIGKYAERWIIELKTGMEDIDRLLIEYAKASYFGSIDTTNMNLVIAIADKNLYDKTKDRYQKVKTYDRISFVYMDRARMCVTEEFPIADREGTRNYLILN